MRATEGVPKKNSRKTEMQCRLGGEVWRERKRGLLVDLEGKTRLRREPQILLCPETPSPPSLIRHKSNIS